MSRRTSAWIASLAWGGVAALSCAAPRASRPAGVAPASRPAPPVRVTGIACAGAHSCALASDGSLACWGADDHGQLGAVPRPSLPDGRRGSVWPVPAWIADRAQAVAAGLTQTCVVDDKGGARCVGERTHLAKPAGGPEAPQTLDLPNPVEALALGAHQGCALHEGGVIGCWGRAAIDGPLRNANGGGRTPSGIDWAYLSEGRPCSDVAVGDDLCALSEDGAVLCARGGIARDAAREPREGEGEEEPRPGLEEVPLPGPAGAIRLKAPSGGCALLESKQVACWAFAPSGDVDVKVVALDAPAKAFDAGASFSCAVLESGQLRCFGEERRFHAMARAVAPGVFAVDVGGAVHDIAIGERHACVLLDSGAVRCFGDNEQGQLGYGHTRAIGDDEPLTTAGDVGVFGVHPRTEWVAPPMAPSASVDAPAAPRP